MRRAMYILCSLLIISFAGCSNENKSKIEGISDDVYQRGVEFIEYLDETPMVGQSEGEEMLNAIAPEGAPDIEALFEDDIYVLWVYHNLKCIDTAAEEINDMWQRLGVDSTVEEEYESLKIRILEATTEQELWDIWNSVGKKAD